MVEVEKPRFDAAAFLASTDLGRRIIQLAPKDTFFSQADPADAVFYLQKGRAKATVISATGNRSYRSFSATFILQRHPVGESLGTSRLFLFSEF